MTHPLRRKHEYILFGPTSYFDLMEVLGMSWGDNSYLPHGLGALIKPEDRPGEYTNEEIGSSRATSSGKKQPESNFDILKPLCILI